MDVEISGTVGNVTYQWIKDGLHLPGETLNVYYLESVTQTDEGWYSVRVEDESKGVWETDPVLVLVFPADSLPAVGLGALALLTVGMAVRGLLALRRRR